VLLDIEGNETFDGGKAVETIDEQPGVFDLSPEALNTLPIQLFLNLASEL